MKTINTTVLIIGGGPAGSALGAYLSRENLDCLIVEKEKFPREHVGESLVIACNRVLEELNLIDELEKANFPKKYGAAWTTTAQNSVFQHDWKDYRLSESVDINFGDRPQAGTNTDYTYHVDRGLFDKILLDKAEKNGATVYQETVVADITVNDDGVICKAKQKNGMFNIHAEMVVDASGRSTLLGRKLNLKENDPDFNQLAIHTWFNHFDRTVDTHKDFIYVHFLPYKHTWVWQIPITETITSIGLVTHSSHVKNNSRQMAEIFYEFVSSQPNLSSRVNQAEQMKPFKMEADYSYKMKQIVGDRFVLIGDAARYVDPIFSSGVSIALNAARMVSVDIINAVKSNNFRKEQFSRYDKITQAGCKNWYDFITLYYKLNVLFTWFVSNEKYKHEVLRFLQGDVYETEESFLISDMRKMSESIQSNQNHVFYKYLN